WFPSGHSSSFVSLYRSRAFMERALFDIKLNLIPKILRFCCGQNNRLQKTKMRLCSRTTQP
ncbi:hypothetical protein PRIPAC_86449, partial [Pristionchus pacificus]